MQKIATAIPARKIFTISASLGTVPDTVQEKKIVKSPSRTATHTHGVIVKTKKRKRAEDVERHALFGLLL